MFDILNKHNEVVDTASSLYEAFNVITALNNSDRENAPFFTPAK